MNDYTLYIALSYGMAAVIWLGLTLHSLAAWRRIKKKDASQT